MANTLGKYNPFRYRGYVYDEETGLYYLNSRYYDPELCRFISADSLAASTSFESGGALGMIPADPSKLVNAIAAGGSIYATSVLTEGTSTAIRGVYEGMTSTDPPNITPPTPQPTTGPVVKNPFIPSRHDVFVVMGGGGKNTNKLAFR